MTKQELLDKLLFLQQEKDYEVAHELADKLITFMSIFGCIHWL